MAHVFRFGASISVRRKWERGVCTTGFVMEFHFFELECCMFWWCALDRTDLEGVLMPTILCTKRSATLRLHLFPAFAVYLGISETSSPPRDNASDWSLADRRCSAQQKSVRAPENPRTPDTHAGFKFPHSAHSALTPPRYPSTHSQWPHDLLPEPSARPHGNWPSLPCRGALSSRL